MSAIVLFTRPREHVREIKKSIYRRFVGRSPKFPPVFTPIGHRSASVKSRKGERWRGGWYPRFPREYPLCWRGWNLHCRVKLGLAKSGSVCKEFAMLTRPIATILHRKSTLVCTLIHRGLTPSSTNFSPSPIFLTRVFTLRLRFGRFLGWKKEGRLEMAWIKENFERP